MNRTWRGLVAALPLLTLPALLHAQEKCVAATPDRAAAFASPLDRAITLHAGSVPLREALDRITAAARVRLSYSRDLVPVERPTCLEFNRAPAGAVLEAVLQGTTLQVVANGHDRVVLTPASPSPRPVADTVDGLPRVVVLDGVRVDALARRPDAPAGVVSTSIDGQTLERQGSSNLASALDGMLPGVWVWSQAANSMTTQYGSLRGASSFGLTSPKLYIDGLEVANPLLISTLDPGTVERVDVLRGPQGAALFGADAIAGVTHIITRQGAADASGSRFTVRSSLGSTSGDYADARTLDQDHGVSLYAGGSARSARLDVSFNSVGDYAPDAATRHLSAVGSARTITDRLAVSGTARFLSQSSALGISPLLQATFPDASARAISISEYTGGFTATWQPQPRWSHTLVAGVNGYAVDGAPTMQQALTASDSALAAAGTAALRSTLRLTSIARLPLGASGEGAFSVSAEHTALRQDGGWVPATWTQRLEVRRGQPMQPRPIENEEEGPDYDDMVLPSRVLVRNRSTSGLSGRFDATLRDALNLTAGIRYDRTTLENASTGQALLPSLGVSWQALGGGSSRLVLRGAYGKGVRWPQVPGGHAFARTMELAPEVQAGTEFGADLSLGGLLALQLTRFDQVATGLVQQVAVHLDSTATHPAMTFFDAQNVGAISNRGWEMAAYARRGRLALSATLALVDSRVRRVADNYTGDLAAGDRMLAVPARTLSLGAVWNASRWNAAISLARASDWVNYDRIALAAARGDSTVMPAAQLRSYWLEYEGATHLRASFSRDLTDRISLRLNADNLLDLQTGEPDNATLLPGRSLSLMLRARL